ncbi:hypothetical protein MC885_006723 [Smutsia gigantea]|nr:hypothetical protein MC885_006723 [Smutsia gigantea]
MAGTVQLLITRATATKPPSLTTRTCVGSGLHPVHRQTFVWYRLQEAFRVALAGHPNPLPVLAYIRLTHRGSGRFLSQTVGVSAALGAAGVVLWGDLSFSSSEDKCWQLQDYLLGTLGPYVTNVTRVATACSQQRCHGHGRCARRDPGQLGSLSAPAARQQPWGVAILQLPLLPRLGWPDLPGAQAWSWA